MDTIFALASAPGKAGVAVIRVSGPEAFSACARLTGWHPEARDFRLVAVRDLAGNLVDRALVLAFLPGHSFTGEASVEFQLHGSPSIVKRVLSILGEIDGVRPAEAGEFTRRALDNERLDLTQVEGLADLIDAETELQRRQAISVFEGVVRDRLMGWKADLVRAAALLEASIDFVEEDVPVDVVPEVRDLLDRVMSGFAEELDGIEVAERLRDGFEVAILGQPNAGKSTLLNRLAGRDVAITSEIAGTTRDIIEVAMDLEGLPVRFLDTAGLRDTGDVVEALGVNRARQRADQADLRVFLRVDADEDWAVAVQPGDLVLWAKSDWREAEGAGVSGKSGSGVSEMLAAIRAELMGRVSKVGSMTRQRHANSLRDAQDRLEAAVGELARGEFALELAAEECRAALSVLDDVLGQVGVEDILDEIFSSFCIGK